MAEEEKTENEEQSPEAEAPAEEQPEAAAEETPAEDPAPEEDSAEEPPPDEADQPADDPAAPGSEAEEAAGGDVAEGQGSGESGGGADAAAGSDVGPKALRRRKRAQAKGPARPQQSPEERAAERIERRRRAAAERRNYRQGRRKKSGEPGTGTPPVERPLAARKTRQGIVVSSKGQKTITVRVEQVGRHRRYEKVMRRTRTLHVHDEGNEAGEGDVVRVVETRPLSKTKRWRLVEILERAR